MINTKNHLKPKIAFFVTVGVSLLSVIMWPFLSALDWEGYTELHTVIETSGTFLPLVIGVIALVRFYSQKNHTFLIIATGFFGTGLLDGYHTIVTSALFSDWFPSPPPSLIPWSWVASRQFLALFLTLSVLVWHYEKKNGRLKVADEKTIYGIAGSLTIASFLFFAFVPLPAAYYPDLFFHRPEELLPGFFFLFAFCGYLYKGTWRTSSFEWCLILAIFINFIGQVFFMAFSKELFDAMFFAAHFFKLLSYVIVLTGLLINMYKLFRQADQAAQALAQINSALELEIQEREQIEVDLIQAKRQAEIAAQTKADFLANMSHEIRTPMNSVIGLATLLIDTDLSTEQRDFVNTIRTSGDALLTIINDILDLSKIESGKILLEKKPFDLRAAVENAVDLVATRTAGKPLELYVEIEPGTPPVVTSDPGRLRQILVNLLSNAIKFTEKGEIVVSVSSEKVGSIQNDATTSLIERGAGENMHRIICRVKDTGIGIPPDKVDRLFKSFSQVDASVTRLYGGTGLGLAISKSLAELLGGSMSVESSGRPGEGSTFTFSFLTDAPSLEQPDHSQPQTSLNPLNPLEGKQVVIVDKSATGRRILADHLSQWGMTPLTAGSTEEAVELLENYRVDIALVDMAMGEFNGRSFIDYFEDHAGQALRPIIIMTPPDFVVNQGTLRNITFMSKPLRLSSLYNCLISQESSEIEVDFEQAVQPEIPQDVADQLPLRILLAEDNLVNQKVATTILKRMGYHADVANNGREAIDALQHQTYDVILMDVQMPQMDGLEATRTICQTWAANERPVIIALTANAMVEDQKLCLAAGMDDYIRKPLQVEPLQDALKRAHEIILRRLAKAKIPS